MKPGVPICGHAHLRLTCYAKYVRLRAAEAQILKWNVVQIQAIHRRGNIEWMQLS